MAVIVAMFGCAKDGGDPFAAGEPGQTPSVDVDGGGATVAEAGPRTVAEAGGPRDAVSPAYATFDVLADASVPLARAGLVADFGTRDASSNPTAFVSLGDGVYFVADDGVHGRELFRTDGTAGGTRLVKDIRPGSLGSDLGGFVVAAGLLYFSADDGVHGVELWRSDGTSAGTKLVADLRPGKEGSAIRSAVATARGLFVASDAAVWFVAAGGAPVEIAKHDAVCPPQLVTVGDRAAFFRCSTDAATTTTTTVWLSDGTTAGTAPLVDLGVRPSVDALYAGLIAAGSSLYVRIGPQLYKAGAQPSSPTLVDTTATGSSYIGQSVGLDDGRLVFVGPWLSSIGVWTTTGAPASTILLAGGPYVGAMRVGPRVFFYSETDTGEIESAGSTDGTPLGTTFMPASIWGTSFVAAHDGLGYFVTPGISIGGISGLLSTDGKTLSTVGEVPGAGLRSLGFLGANTILAPCGRTQNESELCSLDPSATKTATLVAEINSNSVATRIHNVTAAPHGVVFFAGEDVDELWFGSPTGATKLSEFARAGYGFDYGAPLARLGEDVLFPAVGSNGFGLWATNGTVPGTRLVTAIAGHSGAYRDPPMAAAGGRAFFVLGGGGVGGEELWMTDGTAAGTKAVPNASYVDLGYPEAPFLLPFRDGVIFSSRAGADGSFSWFDGTTTKALTPPGFGGSLLAATDTRVFFANGTTLRASTGTGASSLLVDLGPSASIVALKATRTRVFAVSSARDVLTLWATDGTVAGTSKLGDWTNPPSVVWQSDADGDVLFFAACKSEGDCGLWRSDGTLQQTKRVVRTESPPNRVRVLSAGLVVFDNASAGEGSEPWIWDGTSARLAADISPGEYGSNFLPLVTSEGVHYARADDHQHGWELWWLRP